MKVKLNYILYILFFLPYFSSSVLMNEVIMMVTRVVSLISFAIIFYRTLRGKNILNRINLLFVLIGAWLLGISFYKNTLTVEIAYLIYSWLALCLVAFNNIDNNNKELIFSFAFLLNTAVIINIPFIFKGIGIDAYERVFIFGGKNSMQMFFIPAIFINYIVSYLKYNKINLKYACFIILDIVTILFCGASTGIMTILAFVVFAILSKKINLNIYSYAVILLILLLLMFNTNYIMEIEVLHKLIVETLHKDLTFTGRTRVWEYLFSVLKDNLLGYGYGNNIVNLQFPRLNEAHNMFLELLLIGGIPLITMYIYLIFLLLKKKGNPKCNILLAMCFSFFIVGLTESVQFHLQFWIVLITYYKISNNNLNMESEKIINKMKKK